MSRENLRDIYQQVILEHYKKPRHRGKTEPVHRSQRGHNPSWGDTIELTLQLDDDRDRICEVKFSGEGCAIASGVGGLDGGGMDRQNRQELLSGSQSE